MKIFALSLLFLTNIALAEGFDVNKCFEEAGSNVEMGNCLGKDYSIADDKLNAVYKKIVAKLKAEKELEKDLSPIEQYSTEILNRLVEAQRAWVQYKEKNCDLQAIEMLFGSGEGLHRMSCLTEATKARTQELENLLAHYLQ